MHRNGRGFGPPREVPWNSRVRLATLCACEAFAAFLPLFASVLFRGVLGHDQRDSPEAERNE